MMTLKQAFTVAAVQQTAKATAQLCEGCPLQGLHKLCERIEGEPGWEGGRVGGGLLRVLGKFVGRFCPVEACVSYRAHRWMSSVCQALCLDHLPSRGSEGSGGVRGPQGTRPVALLARWCEWSVTSATMEGSRNKRAKNFHRVSQ